MYRTIQRGTTTPLPFVQSSPSWAMDRITAGSTHTRLFGTGNLVRQSRCAIVVAHPDDEIIGAGGLISRLEDVSVIHVTDGSSHNCQASEDSGFEQRHDYAQARRQECVSALAIANVPKERIWDLGVMDHQAPHLLTELANKIKTLLQQLAPDVVLTHPYEGGHPDHDAAAFATHAAVRLLTRNGLKPPAVFEIALHPGKDGKKRVLDFLPSLGRETTTLVLDKKTRELKRRMFDCFATQRETLKEYPLGPERFRQPPVYNFTRAPQQGRLNYENFDSCITRDEWQSLALKAWIDLFPEEDSGH